MVVAMVPERAAAMADNGRLWRLRISIAILGALAVVLVVATAWALFRPGGPLVAQTEPTVRIGGRFSLTSHQGATITDRDLAGQPFTVFFGFTHCPEVCPTTLWEMSEALKELGPEAERLKVLFISVDPKRDTPEFLDNYLQSFDPRIVGLTGTEEDIEEVGKAYRAYWRRIDTEDGGYTMDHTASIYMMDARGEFVGTISYGEDQASRMDKLRRLLAGASA
jgi:protein SCO1/2